MSATTAILLGLLAASVPGTETRTMDIRLADLDGDGTPELIRAVEGGTNQVLSWQSGNWAPSETFLFDSDGSDSEDIAVADFDGDGWMDIAIANEDTRVQQIYFNQGGTGLTPAHDRFDFLSTSNTVIAADLDSDGDVDLVFGDSGPVVFLMNDGNGHFELSRETHPNNPFATQDLEAGDVDRDGDLDIIVASEGPNRLLINDGAGQFEAEASRLGTLPDYEETREADFADLDGDGDLDLYFANVGFQTQSPAGAPDRVLLNDGTGHFETHEGAPPARTYHSLDIDFHDLDGDGDLDGVVAASFNGGVFTLINDGSARFEAGEQLAGPELDALDSELLPDGRLYVAGYRSEDAIFTIGTAED